MNKWNYVKINLDVNNDDWEPGAIELPRGGYTCRIMHDDKVEEILGRKVLKGEQIYQDACDWAQPDYHFIPVHNEWTCRLRADVCKKAG